eukprot:UN32830
MEIQTWRYTFSFLYRLSSEYSNYCYCLFFGGCIIIIGRIRACFYMICFLSLCSATKIIVCQIIV